MSCTALETLFPPVSRQVALTAARNLAQLANRLEQLAPLLPSLVGWQSVNDPMLHLDRDCARLSRIGTPLLEVQLDLVEAGRRVCPSCWSTRHLDPDLTHALALAGELVRHRAMPKVMTTELLAQRLTTLDRLLTNDHPAAATLLKWAAVQKALLLEELKAPWRLEAALDDLEELDPSRPMVRYMPRDRSGDGKQVFQVFDVSVTGTPGLVEQQLARLLALVPHTCLSQSRHLLRLDGATPVFAPFGVTRRVLVSDAVAADANEEIAKSAALLWDPYQDGPLGSFASAYITASHL